MRNILLYKYHRLVIDALLASTGTQVCAEAMTGVLLSRKSKSRVHVPIVFLESEDDCIVLVANSRDLPGPWVPGPRGAATVIVQLSHPKSIECLTRLIVQCASIKDITPRYR